MKIPSFAKKAFATAAVIAAPFVLKSQDLYASVDNAPSTEIKAKTPTTEFKADTKVITNDPNKTIRPPVYNDTSDQHLGVVAGETMLVSGKYDVIAIHMIIGRDLKGVTAEQIANHVDQVIFEGDAEAPVACYTSYIDGDAVQFYVSINENPISIQSQDGDGMYQQAELTAAAKIISEIPRAKPQTQTVELSQNRL